MSFQAARVAIFNQKKGKEIHYYTVEWDPETLSWADFRG